MPVRVFKLRTFACWMKKSGLTDDDLCEVVSEMIGGLIDAYLGGNVVKKRVSLSGQGKRGGARTIVATNLGNRWIFLYGFEKNEQANITKKELRVFQEVAHDLLAADTALNRLLAAEEIQEICHGNKD